MTRAAVSSLPKRILVTLAALAVFRLGCFIPLPGLDVAALFQDMGPPTSNTLSRISIFALGLYPPLLILIGAEATKLVFEPLLRWEAASASNRDRLARILRLMAIVLAGIEAWGIALALEDVKALVPQVGWSFRIGVVATLVGSTAFLFWLGDQITRHGLGHGFWLLWLAPSLSSLGQQLALMGEFLRVGEITQAQLAIAGLWLAAAAVLVLVVAKARFGPSLLRHGSAASWVESLRRRPATFDVAPLFAAAFVSTMLVAGASPFLPIPPGSVPWRIIGFSALAICIGAFYFLRARADLALAPLRGEPVDTAAALRQAAITTALLVVIDLSGSLLVPAFPAVTVLVVTVLVAADVVEALAAYVPQKVR